MIEISPTFFVKHGRVITCMSIYEKLLWIEAVMFLLLAEIDVLDENHRPSLRKQ